MVGGGSKPSLFSFNELCTVETDTADRYWFKWLWRIYGRAPGQRRTTRWGGEEGGGSHLISEVSFLRHKSQTGQADLESANLLHLSRHCRPFESTFAAIREPQKVYLLNLRWHQLDHMWRWLCSSSVRKSSFGVNGELRAQRCQHLEHVWGCERHTQHETAKVITASSAQTKQW